MKTNNKPFFSIIMAVYEHVDFISEAINSVIDQSFVDWELVILDDASQKDIEKELQVYTKDKRIKFYRNDRHLGCGGIKASAVDLTQGDIVGILDADDYIESDALKIVAKYYHNNPEAQVVTSRYRSVNEVGQTIGITVPHNVNNINNLYKSYTSHFLTFTKKIYRKVGGYNQYFKIAEDKDLIYKFEEKSKIYTIDKVLYNYRKHRKGVSTWAHKPQIARLWDGEAQFQAYKRRVNNNISSLEMAQRLWLNAWRAFLLARFKLSFMFYIEARQLAPELSGWKILLNKIFT